jgi:hypothetical protein
MSLPLPQTSAGSPPRNLQHSSTGVRRIRPADSELVMDEFMGPRPLEEGAPVGRAAQPGAELVGLRIRLPIEGTSLPPERVHRRRTPTWQRVAASGGASDEASDETDASVLHASTRPTPYAPRFGVKGRRRVALTSPGATVDLQGLGSGSSPSHRGGAWIYARNLDGSLALRTAPLGSSPAVSDSANVVRSPTRGLSGPLADRTLRACSTRALGKAGRVGAVSERNGG